MLNSTEYVQGILARKTDRDKQRSVGASNLVNACTRCLADDLLGVQREQGTYNMGAIVGTAIHDYVDQRNQDPSALKEYKLGLGYIEGYGTVGSRLDIYRSDVQQVIDLKTSTRDKIANYKRIIENGSETEFDSEAMEIARYTLESYVRQANVYAWSLVQDGYPVETVSIVFIARDGQILDRDIWGFEMPYSEHSALNVWHRGQELWKWLNEPGNDAESLDSNPLCYYCSNIRPFLRNRVQL